MSKLLGSRLIKVFSYNPIVTDWISRVQAKGGSVSTASSIAHNNFVNTLISSGIWTKLSTNSIIFTYGTNDTNGLEEPFIKPSGVTPTKFNWVSGDYSLSTGLNPGISNTTKYINSGFNPATYLFSSSAQLSSYLRTNNDGADAGTLYPIEISSSVGNGTSGRLGLIVKLSNFSNNSLFDCWGISGNDRLTVATTSGLGLFSGSRVSLTDSRIYQNGVQIGSTNTGSASSNIPGYNTYIFADNSSGSANSFSRRIHSYDYEGPGLTSSEETSHYNAVQALQTALGRNV